MQYSIFPNRRRSFPVPVSLPAFENEMCVAFFFSLLLVLIHILTSEHEELDSRGGIIFLH